VPRLPRDIPAWVGQYIGIDFAEKGRTREDGLDCWGLYRLAAAERFGLMLPSHADGYSNVRNGEQISEIIRERVASRNWARVEVGELQVGDLGLFRLAGVDHHVGMIVARGRMLHALAGIQSCVQRLDDPEWEKRFSAFYRYSGPVRLAARPRVFSDDRIDQAIPHGFTIAEMLQMCGITHLELINVAIGDRIVPRDRWHQVKPKPGRIVTVTATPLGGLGGGGGGGKDTLKTVLTIAIMAAGIAAPYALAGLGVAGLVGAGGALTFGGALLSAGVGIGGTLLVSALIPPPRAQLSAVTPESTTGTSLAISGGRNEARPYGVVPLVLGEYQMTPVLAAAPFTEIAGDDQFLRMLFCLGYGEIDVSQIKIGETDIDEFDGVELEIRRGLDNEAPPQLYSSVVHEDSYSVLLDAAAGYVVRTSRADADEVLLDITFPTGLVQLADNGDKLNRSVTFEVAYSPAGAGTWVPVNSASPTFTRGLDLLFRSPECVFGGAGTHAGVIGWGGVWGTKPAYLPANQFSWEVSGYVFADVEGTYGFAIDGSDACDLFIDGQLVTSFYGQHAAAGNFNSNQVEFSLTKGWHAIRARVECRSGNGGAIAIGWLTPGSGAFVAIPANRLAPSSVGGPLGQLNYRWFSTAGYTGTITVTAARADQIRLQVAFAGAHSQYDVRIRRLTADTTDVRIVDKAYLSSIRSITATNPVKLERVATLAVRIKATNQLNGVIDTLNCKVVSVLPDWDKDSGTWIRRGTSNPASIYRAILQGPANKRPLPDSRIDLEELAAWHEECEEKGLQCNAIIDFAGTVGERLRDVAATGRAAFGMRNGKYSIVRDRKQTVPVQHFTPRNSRNFSAEKVFADVPHALRVQFINRDAAYQRDERIVLADGYQIDGKDAFGNPAPGLPEATEFETMEMFGVTSADEAWLHGRYNQAVAKLRPEVFKLDVDVEHLICTRGDLVLVSHDVPLFGSGFGRIVELALDTADNLHGVRLDASVVMETGKTYVLRVRLEDGTSFLTNLVTNEGEQEIVYFAGPVAPSQARPEIGDLFMFGVLGVETRELLVKSITHDRDLNASLSLVDAAPEVLDADTGTIPDYQPGITIPPEYLNRPDAPVIEQIRSDDYVLWVGQDGSLVHRMVISLRAPSSLKPRPVEAQVRIRPKPTPPANAVGPWITYSKLSIDDNQVSILGVDSGVTYQISLRVISAQGVASVWVDAEHTVIGKIIPPPDVQSFDVARGSDGTRLYIWDLGEIPRDIAGVKIRYGPKPTSPDSLVWEAMTDLHDGLLEGASPSELNVPPQGDWRFAIKMFDTAGAESVNALYCDRELGAPRQPEVAITQDARKMEWPGVLTGCHVAADGTLEPDDRATWDNLAGAYNITTWDQYTRWIVDPHNPISYEHPVIDIGVLIDFEPQAVCEGHGLALIEVKHSINGVTFTDWADVKGLASRSIRARYVQFRVTVTAVPFEIPTIREFVMIPRAETVEEYLNDVNTALLGPKQYYGPGDIALPISKGLFAKIKSVSVTFNGTGAGWTWEIVNKSGSPGPRIRIYNPQGVPTDAVIDASVRGLKSIDGSTAELAAGRMQFDDLVNTGMLATL
jgi:cell wall-associated NlpC family hydrolase